jgi:hypothetical protein
MKLTIPQLATLGYIRLRCGITLYSKSTGSKPMKKLKELHLIYDVDSSWGGYHQTSWDLTPKGKKFFEENEKLIYKAMDLQGWL